MCYSNPTGRSSSRIYQDLLSAYHRAHSTESFQFDSKVTRNQMEVLKGVSTGLLMRYMVPMASDDT